MKKYEIKFKIHKFKTSESATPNTSEKIKLPQKAIKLKKPKLKTPASEKAKAKSELKKANSQSTFLTITETNERY